jgi:regulatory protein
VRALQWLAQREHSRQELRDKLLRLLQRGARDAAGQPADGTGADECDAADPVAEVDAVLQWLEQHGHLSDARFTESRVHARQSRFGNRRIQQELQQHGVSLDADARQALQQTELARATEVWRRRYGAPAADAAGRVRQMRFLVGRGFSSDVVRRVVQGAGGEAGASGDPVG